MRKTSGFIETKSRREIDIGLELELNQVPQLQNRRTIMEGKCPSSHQNSQKADRLLPQKEEDHEYFMSQPRSSQNENYQNALQIEIADTVTLPPTPSPIFSYMADWDHSYFSCSRLLESSSTSSDCMGDTTFMEFSDLLDFSSLCGPFEMGDNSSSALGLQEQVVEDPRSRKESVEKSNLNGGTTEESRKLTARQRPLARPHHLGPLPHSYIEDPADRRAKFIDGLLTVGVKIHNMKVRTGATVRFVAKYENHVFDVKAVTRLIKAKEQKSSARTPIRVGAMDRRASSLVEADGDHDHMYAATILKQNERSGVTDHQYNEITTSQASGRKDQRPFIERKSLRDRFARTFITTLFSKVERLINRTGANISLKINYEGVDVTEKNWKSVKSLIRARINHANASAASTPTSDLVLSTPSPASPEISKESDMTWFDSSDSGSHPHLQSLNFERDHDYVMAGYDESHLDSLREGYPPDSTNENACSRTSNVDSDQDLMRSEVLGQELFTARPICQICQQLEPSCTVVESGRQHPNWIRCANPLCLYLVHPRCIGFLVLDTSQLQHLPSFYCPTHRT